MNRTFSCFAALTGVWAFRSHRLTFREGPDGMFGMATALILEE